MESVYLPCIDRNKLYRGLFLLILLPSHSKCNHYPLLSGNRSNMLPRVTIRPFIAHSAISFRRAFHTSMLSLAPKVVATRVLPAQSQARLEAQDFNLTQWQQDSNMPRETLLKEVQGIYICAKYIYLCKLRVHECKEERCLTGALMEQERMLSCACCPTRSTKKSSRQLVCHINVKDAR